MVLLFTSFIAGTLTILAPCVLPLLPVIVGGSLRDGAVKRWRRPLTIAISLAVSVVVFTLLLRATTALIDVPESVWRGLSALIVLGFGLSMVWPMAWDSLVLKLNLNAASNRWLSAAARKNGLVGDLLIGAALGPVFLSCSPTYGLILATVLPASPIEGFIYLLAYGAGLALVLLLVVWLGNKLITRLEWATDPLSPFRRILGLLFVLVAVSIFVGWDKDLQTWLIERGLYDPIGELERSLM